MQVTLYHNPRCSKSRQALEILKNMSVNLTIIEYLKTPPSPLDLKKIILLLGGEARTLLRIKEDKYSELELNNPSLTEEQLINAMHNFPILIERPIVITDKQAIIARPPEKILEILK
ncbi:MAG: arsenate reductase (glutaredoxin) [Candidatus Berkiella sp.]